MLGVNRGWRPKMSARVPKFEPEVIEAATKRNRGDTDRVATTSIRQFKWRGVELVSRYDKHDELETMADMVDAVPSELHTAIQSVFCDSNAGCCYGVELNPCRPEDARLIGYLMENASGGHNGISIHGVTNGSSFVMDPHWGDDLYDA